VGGIMFNEDDSHFPYTRSEDELTPEGVDRFLDPYSDTTVKEMLFCVNAQRTAFDTRAPGWEPVWQDMETRPAWWQNLAWPKHSQTLHERGIDRFARWIDRCRSVGLAPWLSIRANDIHATDDPQSPLHSEFWKAHPECWRVQDRFTRRDDRGLDYGRAEVRARLLALATELAERYDMDGLEIDWMRSPRCFRPGHEAAGAPLLTELMRAIRRGLDAAEDRRGHKVALTVRVPVHPETCRSLGLHAVAWAREGLIERIAPAAGIHVFNDTPVDLWKDCLHGTDAWVCPGMDLRVWPHPWAARCKANGFLNASRHIARGLAAAYLHRGADRVYCFNLFDNQTALCDQDAQSYRRLLQEVGDLEALAGKTRRHVVSFCDVLAPGEAPRLPLPAPCGPHGDVYGGNTPFGDVAAFRIYTGPAPQAEAVQVCLGFGDDTQRFGYKSVIPEQTDVRVNGERCAFAGKADLREPTPPEALWAYAVPRSVLQAGSNLVEVHPQRATSIIWAEIAFRGED